MFESAVRLDRLAQQAEAGIAAPDPETDLEPAGARWLLIAGGLVVVLAAAGLFLQRRRAGPARNASDRDPGGRE